MPIYAFRAAEVRNILDFPKGFKPNARVIKLERNYRSTQPILDAANAVINLSSEGFGRCLKAHRKGGEQPRLVNVPDWNHEALFVAEEIDTRLEQGRPMNDVAVLIRSARHSAMLELELARRGIAFKKFGGTKFTEAAHIKDAISILRWAQNPGDLIAGMRVLNLLPGVGPRTARDIIDSIAVSDLVTRLRAVLPPKAAGNALV